MEKAHRTPLRRRRGGVLQLPRRRPSPAPKWAASKMTSQSPFWNLQMHLPPVHSWCHLNTELHLFLQNFTFNDDFSPSSTSSADLSGLGAEPKTPGLSQSLALSSDEVCSRQVQQSRFPVMPFPVSRHRKTMHRMDPVCRPPGPWFPVGGEVGLSLSVSA